MSSNTITGIFSQLSPRQQNFPFVHFRFRLTSNISNSMFLLFTDKSFKNSDRSRDSEGGRNAAGGAPLRSRQAMGSNISQHSSKGLKGRRARSSGDLCNGDSKSQTESSVCGSVVGDVMGWNRSLPNHLDGNRHLADYSRVNNNYAEFGTYNRSHPKGGRGLRYRVSKSGESLNSHLCSLSVGKTGLYIRIGEM